MNVTQALKNLGFSKKAIKALNARGNYYKQFPFREVWLVYMQDSTDIKYVVFVNKNTFEAHGIPAQKYLNM